MLKNISNDYSRDIIDKMIKNIMFEVRIKNVASLGTENRETKVHSVPLKAFEDQDITVVFK